MLKRTLRGEMMVQVQKLTGAFYCVHTAKNSVSTSQTALCRSSQPLVGLRSRSVEDEQMVQAIVDANPNSEFIYVIDTRPKVWADSVLPCFCLA